MTMRDASRRLLCALALVAAAAHGVALAQDEPELLADAADGSLELEGVTRVRLHGVPGTIAIRAARDNEVRWVGRSLANRRDERALAVWRDGSTLIVGPGSDAPAEEPRFVEMIMPGDAQLEVELLGGVLHLSALTGDVEVRGSGSLEARGLGGAIDVELTDGKVLLESIDGGATVSGRDLELDARSIVGVLSLRLEGGTAAVTHLRGELVADLENTALTLAGAEGPVDVTAIGGTLRLQDLNRGGRVEAEEAPLELLGAGARVEVDTDADVQFRDLKGGLVVRGYGSNVRGSSVAGPLEISSSDAEISVDEIDGEVSVRGDGLRVRVRKSSGETRVVGSSTAVLAEDVAGPLTIETDFGDVVVHRPAQTVTVTSRDGSVRVQEAAGPVNVSADGETVEVGWANLQLQDDCEIRNDSGDVRLIIPPAASGRLRASADYGTIVSTARGVRIGEESSEASATFGRDNKGTLTVVSGGSVFIDDRPSPNQ